MSEENLENVENVQNAGEYSASKITVLEGLEAVRVRPSMYIGDTGIRGLHHLVYEVVDNSIDEALAGFASDVKVIIRADNSITVEDDGRGIPVDMHPTENKPAVEVVLTVLHAGGKFDHNSYKVSGGLHGVGVSCVNALSDWMDVEVCRGGKAYSISFKRGVTSKPLAEIGTTSKRGTKVSFKPDGTIFPDTVYVWDILAKRLRELAFLNRGIHITLSDERVVTDGVPRSEHFHYEGGITEFVTILNTDREVINPEVIYFHRERAGIDVEVAMQYTAHNTVENIHTYTNNINTIEGGTHLVGFQAALTRTINNYIREKYAGLVDTTFACPRILDIQAKDVSKSRSAQDLKKKLGKKILVCVGDGHNDTPMLEGADYAFVPADAALRDRFPNVCKCAHGAVADVIYQEIPKIVDNQA